MQINPRGSIREALMKVLQENPYLTNEGIIPEVNKHLPCKVNGVNDNTVAKVRKELGIVARRGGKGGHRVVLKPLKSEQKTTTPVLKVEDLGEEMNQLPNKVRKITEELKAALREFGMEGTLHVRKIPVEIVLHC